MALALGAILATTRGPESRALFAAGVLVGLAALARPDLGGYALVAIVIATRSWRPVLGAVVVVASGGARLRARRPDPDAPRAARLVPDRRSTDVPWRAAAGPCSACSKRDRAVDWLLYWSPLVLIALAIVRRVRTGSIPPTDLALLDPGHPVSPPDPRSGRHRARCAGRRPGDPAGGLHPVGESQSRVGRYAIASGRRCSSPGGAPAGLARPAPGPVRSRARGGRRRGARADTAPDEPIFAGEVRNGHAFLNPLMAYYLADRPPGVRDTMYNPGVTTTDRDPATDGRRPPAQPGPLSHPRRPLRGLLRDLEREPRRWAPTCSTERWVRTTGWWPTTAPSSSWLCPMSRLLSSRPGTGSDPSPPPDRDSLRLPEECSEALNDLDVVVLGGGGHVGLPLSLVLAQAGPSGRDLRHERADHRR